MGNQTPNLGRPGPCSSQLWPIPILFLSTSIRNLSFPLIHSCLLCDSLRSHLHSHSSVIISSIHFLLTIHSSFFRNSSTSSKRLSCSLKSHCVCDSRQTELLRCQERETNFQSRNKHNPPALRRRLYLAILFTIETLE